MLVLKVVLPNAQGAGGKSFSQTSTKITPMVLIMSVSFIKYLTY